MQVSLTTQERLALVRLKLARALSDSERAPDATALIAVSKTRRVDEISPVLEAGHRIFGENRVQDAQEKWTRLRESAPDVELHMIGPLQSNKASDAVRIFDVIHTLDRPSLARVLGPEIQKEWERSKRRVRVFVQVNTGEEPQKGGVLPDTVDDFLKACTDEYGIAVEGLMCIPPVDDPPSPHFAFLLQMAQRHHLAGLSMGMSADYAAAIRLGATHVRIGTAIFGFRN